MEMSIQPEIAENLHLWNSRLVAWRWIVLVAAGLLVVVWQEKTPMVTASKIYDVLAVLAAINILLWLTTRGQRIIRPSPQALLIIQICIDMLALTVITHFSDSAETPFVMFYIFPVCLVAIVFEKYYWFFFAVLACLLHGSTIMLEYYGILPHYDVFGVEAAPFGDSIIQSEVLVAGGLAAFSTTVFGVGALVHLLVQQNISAWYTHNKLAKYVAARERMAQVGEITAGVAHAIRNPLHGLINSTDMLIDEFSDHKSSTAHLELMMESLQRMDKITTRLLTLSRNTPMEKQLVDFDEFISGVVHQATLDASVDGIPFATTLQSGIRILLDVDHMGEALGNVLDNAVRASPTGGEVQVEATQEDNNVCIRVRDQGQGIAAETMEKVFTPFFSTRAIREGTGLGLSIARSIIEKHGGTIVLANDANIGTIATIVLPCIMESE